MESFKKAFLIMSLLVPLSVFADVKGFWLSNQVDVPESFFLTTEPQEIAKGADLNITDLNITEYGIFVGGSTYVVPVGCLLNGQETGQISVFFDINAGIQKIEGVCNGGLPMRTILPKWDHFPFGKIDFFNYIPQK